LKAKFKADVLSSNIEHHGIEGAIREIAVRECIEPFLTQSYQCSSGKVIDTSGNLSSQIDLVIYHKRVVPPILITRELGLFPIESVRYVFEIKSKITAAEIKDSNKKFRSVAALNRNPNVNDRTGQSGNAITTVLFAFASDIASAELERYPKHTDDEYPPCTVLCVLGKGYWFYDFRKKSWFGDEAHAGSPPFTEFCTFIAGLMNSLAAEEMSLFSFSPGRYVLN
jgi:hypothetical protein